MEATNREDAPTPRIELRPAAPEDSEFLLDVYASTRADELAQTPWDDAMKRAFCRHQYDAQKAEYEARYPDAQYDVILVDGRPAGRLWVGRGAEEIRLLDIALLPWAQRRGVGAALVTMLIEEARASGRRLRHMVFILNEGARRLYERLGFEVFEEVGGAYLHMEWRPKREGAAATEDRDAAAEDRDAAIEDRGASPPEDRDAPSSEDEGASSEG